MECDSDEFLIRNPSRRYAEAIIITFIIITPSKGNPTIFKEFITDIPIVVNMYAISLILTFVVLSLRIVKIANKPTAIPISRNTALSIEPIKNIIIPIRKKANRNIAFPEYLK